MAQAGSSRGPLGPSILKSRNKIHAIPKGNYHPVYHGDASNSSTTHQTKQYMAPTAYMVEPQARAGTTAPSAGSGSGKGPVDYHGDPSSVPQVRESLEPGEIQRSNGASSLASPPSESPVLTNSVLPKQALLDPTIEAAKRYQDEVDRLERERDREDSTYPGPTPDPEYSSQTLRLDEPVHTPRTRSRAGANEHVFDTPVQQPALQRPVAQASVTSAHQKRKVADDNTAAVEPSKKRRQYTRLKHKNTRFEMLKSHSKSQRKEVLRSIRSHWKISEDKLMELPFVPRRTTEVNHPIVRPLDWNTPLLQALEQLACSTKRDFAWGCNAAKEAFESESFLNGATQLTSEIVNVAVKKIQGVTPGRQQAGQATGDVASPRQPIPAPAQQGPAKHDRRHTIGSAENPASAGPSRSATRAPPSPAVSHTSLPIKVEHAVPGAQSGHPVSDDESSGAEDRLELESNARILEWKLMIVRERLAADERKRGEKERKASRLRQHGGSVDDALLL